MNSNQMLTRKVKLLIGCTVLTLFALGADHFLGYLDTRAQRKKFSRELAAEVERKRNSDNVVEICLKTLTDFTWDRVHIFTPYMATETIDENLGYVWQPARRIGMYQRDDVNLLVFTYTGKIVFYVEHERHLGDFKRGYKQGGYSPDEAIFRVVEWGTHDNGRPWLRLEWHESKP